jgi:aspartate kinase
VAIVNSGTLVVKKFGGTSLASPEKIRKIASYLTEQKRMGKDVVVVVSAMGDTTDHLMRLAGTVSSRPPKRELDMLLTAGERISMALLSMAISEMGCEAISFTGSQSGIVTDTSHTQARILDIKAYRVREELEKGKIVIVAGFQGVSPAKEVTTLGRGGSDTTCVALAAAFNAAECDIFTDVDGVYTAHPRLVSGARRIPRISYDEMMDLSFCGAEVLHWRSVEVAKRFGVKIRVGSAFGKEMGTIVTRPEEIEAHDVTAITQDLDLVRILIPSEGDASRQAQHVLGILDAAGINVRFLCIPPSAAKEGLVSVMIPAEQKDAALESLERSQLERGPQIDEKLGIVSIVGQGLCHKPGIARRVLESLDSIGAKPEIISTSGITMTILLAKDEVAEAVNKLHSDLGLAGPPARTPGD